VKASLRHERNSLLLSGCGTRVPGSLFLHRLFMSTGDVDEEEEEASLSIFEFDFVGMHL